MDVLKRILAFFVARLLRALRSIHEREKRARAKAAGELAAGGDRRAREQEAKSEALGGRLREIDIEEEEILDGAPSEEEAERLRDEGKGWR